MQKGMYYLNIGCEIRNLYAFLLHSKRTQRNTQLRRRVRFERFGTFLQLLFNDLLSVKNLTSGGKNDII